MTRRLVVLALGLVVALAVAAVLVRPDAPGRTAATHRAGAAAGPVAADGTPLADLPGLADLRRRLAAVHGARTRVATAIDPVRQRALVAGLDGRRASGVLVDVASGRLLAAAGSGGTSPWRTAVPPGATLRPALAAAKLGEVDSERGPVRDALAAPGGGVPIDLAVAVGAWSTDDLLRRLGLGAPARARDLRALTARGRLPGLQQPGIHGVGDARQFVDAAGRYRDAGDLARATTLQLAQLALALASDGRRASVGVSRAGPAPLEPTWSPEAGAALRRLLEADGRRPVAVAGPHALVAYAPAGRPRIALALSTADGDAGLPALARRLLAGDPAR